jgi:hypothetical protein
MTNIINLKPEDSTTVLVTLSDLISLKDTTFMLPEHAMRELDEAHVIALAATDGTSEIPAWPPLEVVQTDGGLAIIDGYHREAALIRNLWIRLLQLDDSTPAKQTQAIKNALEITADKARFAEALSTTEIYVHIGHYTTEKDVAKAALTANLKHGLPPKSKALVYIALELFDITRGEVPETSQAEIARQVGISRATLNEYLQKRGKAQKKAEAEAVSPTPEEAGAELDVEELTIDKAVKKAQGLIKFLDKLYQEGEERAASEGFHALFEGVINSYINEYFDRDPKELAETIRHELSIAPVTSEQELGAYVKFGQAFLQAMKLGKATKSPAKVKAPVTEEAVTKHPKNDVKLIDKKAGKASPTQA